jgi:hypothetical protein
MKKILSIAAITIAALINALPAHADTAPANCSFYRNGTKQVEASMPCQFYQSQGHIVLTWEDGVVSDFMPEPGRSMVYRDQNGGIVYREVSEEGQNTFKMENGNLYVEFNE